MLARENGRVHRVCLPAAPLAAARAGTRYLRAIGCDSAVRITGARWASARCCGSVRGSAGDGVLMDVMAGGMVELTWGVLKLLQASFGDFWIKQCGWRLAQWMFVERAKKNRRARVKCCSEPRRRHGQPSERRCVNNDSSGKQRVNCGCRWGMRWKEWPARREKTFQEDAVAVGTCPACVDELLRLTASGIDLPLTIPLAPSSIGCALLPSQPPSPLSSRMPAPAFVQVARAHA